MAYALTDNRKAFVQAKREFAKQAQVFLTPSATLPTRGRQMQCRTCTSGNLLIAGGRAA